MNFNSQTRRQWLRRSAGGLALSFGAPTIKHAFAAPSAIKAIAFDAFAVFDPRPTFALTEQLFPGRGAALGELWRTRQFEYAWLRVLSQRYADFWRVTEDALIYAAKALGLDLTDQRRQTLMASYLQLRPWPDAVPALQILKERGLRLALVSNFTPRMLEASIHTGSLEGVFEYSLSTDAVRSYKPAPAAYGMALDAFKLAREQIVFVAFAGWDAAGARSFGYKTFWVNRLRLPAEELEETADGTGQNLLDLIDTLAG
jgi:2-haloacid dehalogenase